MEKIEMNKIEMNKIEMNKILDRGKQEVEIKTILMNFEKEKYNPLSKKGIYVYGEPGIGKTAFVTNILKDLNYDIISYDAGDIRNKSIIEMITKHNVSDRNVLSMFSKKTKKIAIIMDEIDGMNNGDKGGINALIKLIRPKKTKKQKSEEFTIIPILCIGNYHQDKKIKELVKICHTFELKTPTTPQFLKIIHEEIKNLNPEQTNKILSFVNHDLRKLNSFFSIYSKKPDILNSDVMDNILQVKMSNDDTKIITQKLMNQSYKIEDHSYVMNETDRTIVALLWHENIIDVFEKTKNTISIPFYLKLLENMCFADYIDRITFQKQIWQFNEMSSLMKTFYNHKLYHEEFKKKVNFNPSEIRFTKVLTKYSTEYNNSLFVQSLSQKLGMDKKDLFSFFLDQRIKEEKKMNDLNNTSNNVQNNTTLESIELFENYEISKLDIHRMYRYLEKHMKEEKIYEEDEIDESTIEM